MCFLAPAVCVTQARARSDRYTSASLRTCKSKANSCSRISFAAMNERASNTAGQLHGRLALVTGGGSGIGCEVCLILAQRGARVLVADIDLEAAKVTAATLEGPPGHQAIHIDVGSPESVRTVFDNIQSRSGEPLSIVVNCAGILPLPTPFVELDVEEFDRVMKVNLRGTFLVMQAAAQRMQRDKVTDGRIVNMSSILARTSQPGEVAYSASKAAVTALTRTAAVELASSGIRVTAVAPSMTHTPMVTKAFSADRMATLATGIPMGRAAQPSEVAAVVAFLCGAESSFVTGSTFDVSGGL